MRKALLALFVSAGLFGLFLEPYRGSGSPAALAAVIIDYSLIAYLLGDFLLGLKESRNNLLYIKRNLFSFLFLVIYLGLFVFNLTAGLRAPAARLDSALLSVLRNLLLVLKIFGRFRKISSFIQSIITKPAQTVVFSFIMVILIGALVLMMPMMSNGPALSPIDALFTATSAVCVTGLIVVDTATRFTMAGQAVLMILIQIGGLGIMLLSFFMVFLFRQKLSVKDRNLLSYMLNSQNTSSLKQSVKRIILLTFLIEGSGALLLFPAFLKRGIGFGRALFYSLFHGVSAFCNAGFALFSDSLMSFDGSLTVNLVISALIFAGGISFAVLTDCFSVLRKRAGGAKAILSINSRVVLIGTGTLLLLGMLLIYRTEHRNILTEMPLGEQYLAAFFQSVTLRTAGFNTLPFERLGAGTLMIMMGIMFVGGASGSTAGGIKVNTLGVVWAYMRSFRRGEDEILLYRHRVAKESVLQAFTVIAFGLLSTFMVSAVLMVTERAEPLALIFETVSAFATVGLSTGITGGLSSTGKIGIILLMFLGRLGPLTLLTASSGREKQSRISYPEASSILIG